MKTNGEWSGRNALKAEFYQTWADYHLRYLNLMAAANMTLWGISTGKKLKNIFFFNLHQVNLLVIFLKIDFLFIA